MSSERRIVRVMPYPSDEGSFYVDWHQEGDYAEFTVDMDHPLARHLKPHQEHTMLVVASTEPIEWMVTKTVSGPRWGRCRVSLQSRPWWVKSRLISDEYLEWLGAVS